MSELMATKYKPDPCPRYFYPRKQKPGTMIKEGDRIIVTADPSAGHVKKGMLGTVRGIIACYPPIGTEWDTLTSGHDFNGYLKPCVYGKGWYIDPKNIRLHSRPKTKHAKRK
jgi:hypothetical protein